MAKIFLNEGTEIEVKETKKEIRELIRAKIFTDYIYKKKDGENTDFELDDHFIKVTMFIERARKLTSKWLPYPKSKDDKGDEIPTDLYYKRILFIYD